MAHAILAISYNILYSASCVSSFQSSDWHQVYCICSRLLLDCFLYMATFNRTCKIQTKCNTSENVICSIENTVLFRPLSFQNLVTVCVTHPNHLNIITAQGTPRSHQPLPQFKERAQKEPIAEWLSNKSIWTCVRTSLICRGPNPQATVHPLPVVCGRHQRSFVRTAKYESCCEAWVGPTHCYMVLIL